jgi:hypothetical protein
MYAGLSWSGPELTDLQLSAISSRRTRQLKVWPKWPRRTPMPMTTGTSSEWPHVPVARARSSPLQQTGAEGHRRGPQEAFVFHLPCLRKLIGRQSSSSAIGAPTSWHRSARWCGPRTGSKSAAARSRAYSRATRSGPRPSSRRRDSYWRVAELSGVYTCVQFQGGDPVQAGHLNPLDGHPRRTGTTNESLSALHTQTRPAVHRALRVDPTFLLCGRTRSTHGWTAVPLSLPPALAAAYGIGSALSGQSHLARIVRPRHRPPHYFLEKGHG